jgi:hypothetical protein
MQTHVYHNRRMHPLSLHMFCLHEQVNFSNMSTGCNGDENHHCGAPLLNCMKLLGLMSCPLLSSPQILAGVRVGEFHGLSTFAVFVPAAVALKLQTLWDSGVRLVSLLDDRWVMLVCFSNQLGLSFIPWCSSPGFYACLPRAYHIQAELLCPRSSVRTTAPACLQDDLRV